MNRVLLELTELYYLLGQNHIGEFSNCKKLNKSQYKILSDLESCIAYNESDILEFLKYAKVKKPRIEIDMQNTSRSNFSFKLAVFCQDYEKLTNDFSGLPPLEMFERPINEIMWVHDMTCLFNPNPWKVDKLNVEINNRLVMLALRTFEMVMEKVNRYFTVMEDNSPNPFHTHNIPNTSIEVKTQGEIKYLNFYNVNQRKLDQENTLKISLQNIAADSVKYHIDKAENDQLKIWLANETRIGVREKLCRKLKVYDPIKIEKTYNIKPPVKPKLGNAL